MNDGQNKTLLHPFFTKAGGKSQPRNPMPPFTDVFVAPLQSHLHDPQSTKAESTEDAFLTHGLVPANSAHEANSNTPVLDGGNDQKSGTSKAVERPRGKKTSPAAKNDQSAPSTADDTIEAESETRRKRRRVGQIDPGYDAGILDDAVLQPHQQVVGSEDVRVPASSPSSLLSCQLEGAAPVAKSEVTPDDASTVHQHNACPAGQSTNERAKTPPKKMLKLNSGGRLVSPVTNDIAVKEEGRKKRAGKRGRPKKEKHLLVVCHYLPQSPTGLKIDRILSAQQRCVPSVPSGPALPSSEVDHVPAKPSTAKVTHPFFLGRPKEEPLSSAPVERKPTKASAVDLGQSPRKTSAVTPGKLRAERQSQRAMETDDSSLPAPSGAARDKMMVKHPGMTEAPWPWKDVVHTRDLDRDWGRNALHPLPVIVGLSRKMKHRIAAQEPSHNLLSAFQKTLDFKQSDNIRPDGFRDPPPCMRLPTRVLVPGSEIQNLVKKQLGGTPKTPQNTLQSGPDAAISHPACQAMYDAISATLTPYDQGRSEVMAWAQKYAPKTAAQVLQPGKESLILRNWMKALTIMAVESSSSQTSKLDKPDRERKHKRKRRKKAEDLEGFIVDAEDDAVAMDELTDPDENPWIAGARTGKRSLVQTADLVQCDRTKLGNAILISGPPGSGKTAMVHATAKELGFEVFEINSGARRSGKDVLDKVGDMVENHLVQRHSAESGSISADEDGGRLSEAFKKDLASGRQGTMASFFKPKLESSQEPRKVAKPSIVEQVKTALPKTKVSRNQKQSLILLEEVDVLFEEDKNFWSTVFTLIENSKRPVIMTCNDEDLVPIQALKLHAILRLSGPPADLATDYMLLLAAREGHVLSREAVSALYEFRGQDLRQTIADLQLWCQMGVGDPRGGLGWMFQRWPPGRGLDEHCQALRVVSQNSYQLGMGCFYHDPQATLESDSVEETILESWQHWDLDPRDELFAGFETQRIVSSPFVSPQNRLAALRRHESFMDSMSAIDVFCVGLPGDTRIDTTQPSLPDKARLNYINGMALLQTPQLTDYSNLDTRLAVTSTHLTSIAFSVHINTTPSHHLNRIRSAAPETLSRADFSTALDPLAAAPTNSLYAAAGLTYSALDGAFGPIATDIAPYVRSITAYDLARETQRTQMHGPEGTKKARTTRAARSALEGGLRRLTRREKWWDADVDTKAILDTGGDWPRHAFVNAEGNAGLDDVGSKSEI
ncbi:hypothetical protein MBLNU459_g3327t1 [Dothideomycetes sp. NU459]